MRRGLCRVWGHKSSFLGLPPHLVSLTRVSTSLPLPGTGFPMAPRGVRCIWRGSGSKTRSLWWPRKRSPKYEGLRKDRAGQGKPGPFHLIEGLRGGVGCGRRRSAFEKVILQ